MSSPRDDFINATFWHGSRQKADAILAAHPELKGADIHLAAIVGDDEAVRRFIAADPASVRSKGGPHDVEPIVHLCFSAYLRDRSRSDAFARAAEVLFDAGADVNGGFYDTSHSPPSWESLIYGAAAVHFNPTVTKVLLDRGIDPNDGETPYHIVEGPPEQETFRLLVESGRWTPDSMATALLRTADWHDHDGMKMLLDAGADPNHRGQWDWTALRQAIRRNNWIGNIDLLLDHGTKVTPGDVATAVRRGRKDILESFRRRGVALPSRGLDALILACAMDDAEGIESHREHVSGLLAEGARLIAEFACSDNAAGVGRLIDLGVPVDARYSGDAYFGIPSGSTALHVAAWMSWTSVVKLLIARGADVNAKDGNGRTPRELAERAAADSYWQDRAANSGIVELLRG